MQNLIKFNICQHADDTTCYEHFRTSEMNQYVTKFEVIMSDMLNYAKSNIIVFTLDKTKSVLFSTKRKYNLKNLSDPNVFNITVENRCVERVKNWKVLGVIFDENLSWNVHINEVVRSCFAKLLVLRKLKRYTNHNRRKQLAEARILSKTDCALPVLLNANKRK